MRSRWSLLLFACGVVALTVSACLPHELSTPISGPRPTTDSAASSRTPGVENGGETPPPDVQPALTQTPGFQVDKTLAPEFDGQEENVKNTPLIPTPMDPYLSKLVQQARDDLARRLGVPAEQIDLVALESVVWPDGSLGCPQPGMVYTQVMVDGLLIRFQAQGKDYEYHSGGNRQPFLCEKP